MQQPEFLGEDNTTSENREEGDHRDVAGENLDFSGERQLVEPNREFSYFNREFSCRWSIHNGLSGT